MNGMKHRQLFDDPELGFILLLIGTIIAFAELLLYRFFNVLFCMYLAHEIDSPIFGALSAK